MLFQVDYSSEKDADIINMMGLKLMEERNGFEVVRFGGDEKWLSLISKRLDGV